MNIPRIAAIAASAILCAGMAASWLDAPGNHAAKLPHAILSHSPNASETARFQPKTAEAGEPAAHGTERDHETAHDNVLATLSSSSAGSEQDGASFPMASQAPYPSEPATASEHSHPTRRAGERAPSGSAMIGLGLPWPASIASPAPSGADSPKGADNARQAESLFGLARRPLAAPAALSVHPQAGAVYARGNLIFNAGKAIASAPGLVSAIAVDQARPFGNAPWSWAFGSGNGLYASASRSPGYALAAWAPGPIAALAIASDSGDLYFASAGSAYKIAKATGEISAERSYHSTPTALAVRADGSALAAAIPGEGIHIDGALAYPDKEPATGLGYDAQGNLYHASGARIWRNGQDRPGLEAASRIEAMAIEEASGEATFWSSGAFSRGQTTVYLSKIYPSAHGPQLYVLAAPQNYLVHKYPTILWIHGGGWIGGTHEDDHAMMDKLAARGFVVASPQYSLAPVRSVNTSYPSASNPSAVFPQASAPLRGVPETVARAIESDYGLLMGPQPQSGLSAPAAPDDIRSFEDFMRSRASEFNLDEHSKTTLAGASAGAHLAMLEAARAPYAHACLIDIAGPSSFGSESLWTGPLGSAGAYVWHTMLLNFAPEAADRAAIDILSKTSQIQEKTSKTLVIHSRGDTLVPYAQAEALAASLGADFPAMALQTPFLRDFGGRVLPDIYAGHNLVPEEVQKTLESWLDAHCK